MKTRKSSIEQIVEEQVQRWEMLHAEEMKEKERIPLINDFQRTRKRWKHYSQKDRRVAGA